jgi:hypothetical protein
VRPAVYVLRGRAYAYYGEGMDGYLEAGPGDFAYIPANLAHVVGCPANGEPFEYVVSRDAPKRWSSPCGRRKSCRSGPAEGCGAASAEGRASARFNASDCLERPSEKGYEQRSERGFGWYTEGKMDQNPFFGGPQGYVEGASEAFRTVSKKLSKKSGRPQNEGVRSLRNEAKELISLRYAGDFCARDTTERLFRQFLEAKFSEVRLDGVLGISL